MIGWYSQGGGKDSGWGRETLLNNTIGFLLSLDIGKINQCGLQPDLSVSA